jgi:hypothetical protein
MPLESGDTLITEVTGLLVCPFCNGEIVCIKGVKKETGALHSYPSCEEWRQNDPARFLRLVRFKQTAS